MNFRTLCTARVFALVLISVPFNLHCSSSRPTSLRLKSISDSTSEESPHLSQITFHLLDVDPFYLVIDGENDNGSSTKRIYETHPRMKVLAGKMNARRFGGYSLSSDVFLFLDQSKPLWEKHVIKSGETDTAGDGRADDLKPGSYWLMGYTRNETAFWLQQIDVKDGVNQVFLERANALYFK